MQKFDETVDVLVVGSGCGGMIEGDLGDIEGYFGGVLEGNLTVLGGHIIYENLYKNL